MKPLRLSPLGAVLWAAFFVALSPSLAMAQGTVQGFGAATAGQIPMYAAKNLLLPTGGSASLGASPGNQTNAGTLPSGLALVNPGQALALYSGYASATYAEFKIGFDGSGNALFTIDRVGSGASPTCNFSINGVLTACFPSLTGGLVQTLGHTFWGGPTVGQNRLTDRVFIGAAVADTGFNTFPQADWFSQLAGNTLGGGDTAQAYILGDINAIAGTPPKTAVPFQALVVANGSLNSISTGVSTYSTPRAADFLFVNNPTAAPSGGGPKVPGWAILVQSYRYSANAGQTYGIENEVANFSSLVTGWTPDTATGYGTIALELGCGGGLSSAGQYRCTVAMYVAANPMAFGAGILFFPGSLAADGPGGTVSAMMMPYNYQIQWFNAGLTAQIFGDTSGNLNIITGSGRLIVSSIITSTANNAALDAPTGFVSGLAVNGTMGVNYNAFGFIPNVTNVKTLGDPTHLWSTIYGTTVNTVNLIVTQTSPASGAACTAGQIVANTGFIYACSASGAWQRGALTGGY